MKVFWVLAWNNYYPGEALENVKGQFHTREEAEHFAQVMMKEADMLSLEGYNSYDNIRIVDISEMI